MILINRGEANTVALTLTEKTTLSPVYYLFEFYNNETKVSQYFIAEDISTERTRYNKFIISETDSPAPLDGEVSLELSGTWKYIIREQTSNTNLDPALAGEIVEIGKVRVIGTPESITAYSPTTDSNIVYTP